MSIPALKWAFSVQGLSTVEKAVLLALAYRSNDSKGHSCYPGIKRIAREASCHRTTALNAIGKLEAKELIQVERKHGGSGGGSKSNRYTLNLERKSLSATIAPRSESRAPHSESRPPHSESRAPLPEQKEEPKGEQKEKLSRLKGLKIGSPEVQAEARRRRHDLRPEVIQASTVRFIQRHGDAPTNQKLYWDWIEGTHGDAGANPAEKRKADLLALVPNIIPLSQRPGESMAAYLDRIEAANNWRLAQLG